MRGGRVQAFGNTFVRVPTVIGDFAITIGLLPRCHLRWVFWMFFIRSSV
jgi:hypothetical protein